jgi:hypothetical protein
MFFNIVFSERREAMGELQVQVLAKAKVLDCPIDAGFVKDGNKNIIVVYGKADPSATAKTLTEIVAEFSNMFSFGAKPLDQAIKDSLPTQSATPLDKITLQLKEVFFIKSNTLPDKITDESKRTSDPSSEYAFWFELTTELTQGWPIEVDSVSVKFWNTKNDKIKQDMNINAMNDLLAFGKNSQK